VPLPARPRERGDERLNGLFPHLALLAYARPEGMELHRSLTFAEPQLDAAAGEEVERRHTLGDTDRVIGRELDDPVTEPDAPGALARRAEEHFGRRAVRILLEEVVLDAPRVVEAEAIRQLDLRERVLEQLVLAVLLPRAW